jgi:hypothetical protein
MQAPRGTATIVILMAILVLILFICFTLPLMMDVYGQTNATRPQINQVVEEVPALVEQVDQNSSLTTTIGTGVAGLIAYATGKFLKDKKDKEKIENYASETDKIIFNHVMDNYNDFAGLAQIEAKILEIKYTPGNENLTDRQILDLVIDPVTKETIGMRKKKHLDNIVEWNIEYYGTPSNDPTIVCPDPKNKIARTMTDIRKYSVPNTTASQTANVATTVPTK